MPGKGRMASIQRCSSSRSNERGRAVAAMRPFFFQGTTMRHDVAEQALAALYDASRKMNLTLCLIQEECSDEEFRKYRRGTGYAMGYLYTDVIMLIEKEHPDLEPEEMRERRPDDYPPPQRAEQRT